MKRYPGACLYPGYGGAYWWYDGFYYDDYGYYGYYQCNAVPYVGAPNPYIASNWVYATAYNDAYQQCLAYNPSCLVSCSFLYYR